MGPAHPSKLNKTTTNLLPFSFCALCFYANLQYMQFFLNQIILSKITSLQQNPNVSIKYSHF